MSNLMFITPKLSGGGAERVLALLASELSETNVVTVVTLEKKHVHENYPISPKVTVLNLYEWAASHPEIVRKQTMETSRVKEEAAWLGQAVKNDANHALEFLKRLMEGRRLADDTPYKSKALRVLCALIRSGAKLIMRRAFHSKDAIPDLTTAEKAAVLADMKRSRKVNCAISFLNGANHLNALSKIGERTIISIRSSLEGRYVPPEYLTERSRDIIRESCKLADTVVAVSKGTAASLLDLGICPHEKLVTICNCSDTASIISAAEAHVEDKLIARMDAAPFVFITVNRLVKKKGQWHLIRAFKKVLKRHPGALLVILGREGNKREDVSDVLKEAIRANGLEGSVVLAGHRSNPHAYEKHADAFVLSSFNEGFPNALVEAMALGLPVISCDCPAGPREILSPATDIRAKARDVEYAEYGILVPECSGEIYPLDRPLDSEEECLANAMELLVSNGGICRDCTEKSRKRAAMFSKEAFFGQWQECIDGS